MNILKPPSPSTLSRNQQRTITNPRPRSRLNIFRRLQAATGTRAAIYFPQVETVASDIARQARMEIRKPLSEISQVSIF